MNLSEKILAMYEDIDSAIKQAKDGIKAEQRKNKQLDPSDKYYDDDVEGIKQSIAMYKKRVASLETQKKEDEKPEKNTPDKHTKEALVKKRDTLNGKVVDLTKENDKLREINKVNRDKHTKMEDGYAKDSLKNTIDSIREKSLKLLADREVYQALLDDVIAKLRNL